MITRTKWFLFGVALTMQIGSLTAQDAQRKEINPSSGGGGHVDTIATQPDTIATQPDAAQGRTMTATVIDWLLQVGNAIEAQRKE